MANGIIIKIEAPQLTMIFNLLLENYLYEEIIRQSDCNNSKLFVSMFNQEDTTLVIDHQLNELLCLKPYRDQSAVPKLF